MVGTMWRDTSEVPITMHPHRDGLCPLELWAKTNPSFLKLLLSAIQSQLQEKELMPQSWTVSCSSSLLSIAVTKTQSKGNLGAKGLFLFILPGNMLNFSEGKQSRYWSRNYRGGTLPTGSSLACVQLILYMDEGHLPRDGTAHSWWGPSRSIEIISYRYGHKPIWDNSLFEVPSLQMTLDLCPVGQ